MEAQECAPSLPEFSSQKLKLAGWLGFWLFCDAPPPLLSLQPLEFVRKTLREKQNKKNSGQPVPSFPPWVYERPALIGDFLSSSCLSTDTIVPIGGSCKGAGGLTGGQPPALRKMGCKGLVLCTFTSTLPRNHQRWPSSGQAQT